MESPSRLDFDVRVWAEIQRGHSWIVYEDERWIAMSSKRWLAYGLDEDYSTWVVNL